MNKPKPEQFSHVFNTREEAEEKYSELKHCALVYSEEFKKYYVETRPARPKLFNVIIKSK